MEMVNTKTTFPKYPAYKDSGVEWLGKIPEEWNKIKLKLISEIYNGDSLNEKQKELYTSDKPEETPYISSKDINVNDASANYNNGLRIPKEENKLKKAFKNSTLLCIEGGSAGRKLTYLQEDVFFVNKLASFQPKSNVNSLFLHYSLRSGFFGTQFKNALTGLIGGVSLSLLKNFEITLPPKKEQTAIAAFLDDKCSKIDRAIALKEKLIVLLKERKQIIIQNAVTKGLDPNVKLKDSGVEWIGEIPAHWEVKKLKYVLKERNERSVNGEEPLLMMSQVHGLVVRSEFHDKAEIAASSVGAKLVYYGDLVFNKLKAHLGVFFKSSIDFKGIVSPDYAVYYSNGLIYDVKYLELLFRHPNYIGQFIIRATGVAEGLIRLYTGDLFEISIPIPTKEEQTEILSFIETQSTKIDRAISLQQSQIEKLKEYKASLIDSAVTGKIKVS